MKTLNKVMLFVAIIATVVCIMALEAEYLYEKESKRTVAIYDDWFAEEPEIVGEMPTIIHKCEIFTGEEPVLTNDWWRFDAETFQWIKCH